MTNCTHPQAGVLGSACPEKAADMLTQCHMDLLREAAQALHRATADGPRTSADMDAWLLAAERLAVALVSRLEVIEEADHDRAY